MRVLVVSSTFPSPQQPNRGIFVHERVRHLAKRCEVTVVAPVPWFPGNRWTRADRDGIPRVEQREGFTVHHPRFLSIPRYGKALDGALYFLSLLPFLTRLRRRFPFDVVDAHFAYPDGLAATLLARWFHCPVVVTLRGSIVRLSRYRSHRPQLRWTLRHATRITAVADYLRRIAGDLGIPEDRIRVIHNGVDSHLFAPRDREEARRTCGLPAGRRVLLTVAALYDWKGQHRVVEILPDLVREHPDLLYVMVGGPRPEDPRYAEELAARAERLGVAGHIRLAGVRPHHELAAWFNAADLFVLPTKSEGCPNVLLEALASGVPVVASRVGGVPEIVRDGVDGHLPPYGDQAALRDAILKGLAAPWDRDRLARHAQTFDWRETAEQALEELSAALKARS